MANKALEALKKNLQAKLDQARKATEGATSLPEGVQGPLLPNSGNARGKKEGLAHAREGHAGRRGDILEAFNNKTGDYKGRADNAKPPLLIKVSIAGSGFEVWKTHKNADKTIDTELARIDVPKLDGIVSDWAPQSYANDKGDASFSGPLVAGGLVDQGKNSIDNLAKTVPPVILKAIPKDYKDGSNVVLIIKAHSRGAVAASIISKKLKSSMPKMKIELTQFDPVPGPSQRGKKVDIAVGDYTKPGKGKKGKAKDVKTSDAVDESTVIYSMGSGYAKLKKADLGFFTPQRVHGAKRIIVSGQNHGGGLLKGFMYNKEKFKGARVNSLPPGAYHDVGVISDGGEDDGVMQIEKMTKDDFMAKLAFTDSIKVADADRKRYDIVRKSLEEFFAKNG